MRCTETGELAASPGVGAAQPFERVPISAFCERGPAVLCAAKRLLFRDALAVDLLVAQALLCPRRAEVLDLPRWERTWARASVRCGASPDPEPLAQAFLHALGIAASDLEGIPPEAFHSGLEPSVILGQNRIGYMPMGNVDFQHGLMLGGLGTGGIERTPQGSFRRMAITCTSSNVEDLELSNAATQFHVFLDSGRRRFASVLNTDAAPVGKLTRFARQLSPADGSYHALYPRQWWVYRGDALPAVVRIHAYSPVLPHNYREASYPVVVYEVVVENTQSEPLDAAFMFTLQNLVGWLPEQKRSALALEPRCVNRLERAGIRALFDPEAARDRRSGWSPDSCGNYNRVVESGEDVTVVLGRRGGERVEGHGQMALATRRSRELEVSIVPAFDAMGDGGEVASFFESGRLSSALRSFAEGTHLAAAISVRASRVPPGGHIEFPLVLAYDFPLSRHGECCFEQRYSAFFSQRDDRVVDIAAIALRERDAWKQQLGDFHRAVTAGSDLPLWARGAVINKLNLLQTTSVGWLQDGSSDGILLLSEANKDDYDCVETLDVSSYAMARLLFWPRLEAAALTRFAASVDAADPTHTHFHSSDERAAQFEAADAALARRVAEAPSPERRAALQREREWFAACRVGPRKERFAVPHDLWSTSSGPGYNAYTYQNANLWPDLPARGMLQLFRNHRWGAGAATLAAEFAAFARSMRWALDRFDLDGDSLPEFLIGELEADAEIKISLWTFDNLKWTFADGMNACTAGLWVVALNAAARLASELELDDERAFWGARAERARRAYDDTLWDAELRRYRLGPGKREVFADCLHFFYDRALGIDGFDAGRVRATLEAIYRDNVRPFGDGFCGAVNATLDGRPCDGEQTIEMWTGVSFVLGLAMLAHDMNEGWDVLFGTEALATHRAGHFADWAEAYTLEPGIDGVPAYGMRAKNYLRCLSLVNLLAVSTPKSREEARPAADHAGG